MEKIDNLLYSLIPLIVIILLSWLFSYLGSRRRKETEGEETSGTRAGDQFFDFFDRSEEEETPTGATVGRPEVREEFGGGVWSDHPALRGPEVTAKPIKPKWWGA
jgi:hypothetical protein